MTTYSQFRPTAFDPEGLGLPDRQDWLVLPVIQTRDSGPLEVSNFRVALQQLDGESNTVEVHHFNHWGPGWFEIILAHPSREADVTAIEESLEEYPVLDDVDCGREEATRRDTVPDGIDLARLAE